MHITITTLSDQLFTIEVSEDLELENFKALCQVETGVPAQEMSIVWNGRPLHDDKLTLNQYGIHNGDIVLVQQLRGQISHPSEFPNIDFGSIHLPGSERVNTRREDDPEFIRNMLLKDPSQMALLKERNPPLADALSDRVKFAKVFEEQRQARIKEEQKRLQLLTADPFDPHAQQQIEEAI
ncbi:cyanamide hydratase, partial [Bulinus truncatus]